MNGVTKKALITNSRHGHLQKAYTLLKQNCVSKSLDENSGQILSTLL